METYQLTGRNEPTSLNEAAKKQREDDLNISRLYNEVCFILKRENLSVFQVKYILKRIKADLLRNAKI